MTEARSKVINPDIILDSLQLRSKSQLRLHERAELSLGEPDEHVDDIKVVLDDGNGRLLDRRWERREGLPLV